MSFVVTEESFNSLHGYWKDSRLDLNWGTIFVLPLFLEVWWQVFGADARLYIRAVRQNGKIIGIAPLMVRDKTARIIGSANVCDYLDFVTGSGTERDFSAALLDNVEGGIHKLDLVQLRQDSAAMAHLLPAARERKRPVFCHPEDVSLEMDLPSSWDEYLAGLRPKQRHEVERKLRRLSQAGATRYHSLDAADVDKAMDIFIRLFRDSRTEKDAFMTGQMESFFRLLADSMAKAGLLGLGFLEMDGLPAAAVMYFDYQDCIYLYNSGYDRKYSSLSAGLVCKVLCIRDSIQRGKKRFDFLKGGESYKYQLGGRPVSLYDCEINLRATQPQAVSSPREIRGRL